MRPLLARLTDALLTRLIAAITPRLPTPEMLDAIDAHIEHVAALDDDEVPLREAHVTWQRPKTGTPSHPIIGGDIEYVIWPA